MDHFRGEAHPFLRLHCLQNESCPVSRKESGFRAGEKGVERTRSAELHSFGKRSDELRERFEPASQSANCDYGEIRKFPVLRIPSFILFSSAAGDRLVSRFSLFLERERLFPSHSTPRESSKGVPLKYNTDQRKAKNSWRIFLPTANT